MTAADNNPVDLRQERRRQQRDIVDQTLQVVARLVEQAVAKHLPDGLVMVGQLLETVEIAVHTIADQGSPVRRPFSLPLPV